MNNYRKITTFQELIIAGTVLVAVCAATWAAQIVCKQKQNPTTYSSDESAPLHCNGSTVFDHNWKIITNCTKIVYDPTSFILNTCVEDEYGTHELCDAPTNILIHVTTYKASIQIPPCICNEYSLLTDTNVYYASVEHMHDTYTNSNGEVFECK